MTIALETWTPIASWRILADKISGIRPFSAQRDPAGRRSWSALSAQERLGSTHLDGTNVPKRCSHEKRQAADEGVGNQCHPQRRSCGNAHGGEDADQSREDNKSCDHSEHPLPFFQGKCDGAPWQDCGLALVNLRRFTRRTFPLINQEQFGVGQKSDPGWKSGGPSKMRFLRPMPGGLVVWRRARAAATCREGYRPSREGFPIARVPCLSFVMPAQHGTPVAGFGDGT